VVGRVLERNTLNGHALYIVHNNEVRPPVNFAGQILARPPLPRILGCG
jgi:hypothetical protein